MNILNPKTRIMIVEARFYEDLAEEMAAGAIEVLEEARVKYERFSVPGSFEIPSAIKFAIKSMEFDSNRCRFDGYIALGCVIRGETTHYDYVCGESARGLASLTRRYSLALGYGVLTCENGAQAWARAARDQGNKGAAAANACLDMIAIKNRFGLYPR